MTMDFKTAADDFFVNLTLETVVDLPSSGATVRDFCESVRKQFPQMTNFYRREDETGRPRMGPFVLEGNREAGSYQWMELHGNQVTAGWFNPSNAQVAFDMHAWLLQRCMYFLGVSGLDIDSVRSTLGFNLDYRGNRDALVAGALLGGSGLGAIVTDSGSVPLECEPTLVIGLDEEMCMQGHVHVMTRSNSYQVRTGQYSPDPISVYFGIRSFPRPGHVPDFVAEFPRQCSLCEDLARRVIVPNIVTPIATAIASQ